MLVDDVSGRTTSDRPLGAPSQGIRAMPSRTTRPCHQLPVCDRQRTDVTNRVVLLCPPPAHVSGTHGQTCVRNRGRVCGPPHSVQPPPPCGPARRTPPPWAGDTT